jgi:hypothetical protein
MDWQQVRCEAGRLGEKQNDPNDKRKKMWPGKKHGNRKKQSAKT